MGIASVLFRYGSKALKLAPEAILGTGTEVAGKAMRKTSGSIFAKAEAGVRALEKDVAKKSTQGGFFSRLWKNVKSFAPDVFHRYPKVGIRAAKIAGKSTTLGALKGVVKGVAKKLPFIGAIATVAFEIPNIIETAKDKGIMAAAGEVLKSSARLGGGAAGAAIGSAICPGIGSVVGWVVGEWLTGMVVGKSYSEQKAEAQETQAKTPQPQQYTLEQIAKLKELGITDEELSQAQANGFTYEEALKVLQASEQPEAIQTQQPVTQSEQATQPVQTNGVGTPQVDAQIPSISTPMMNPFNNPYSPMNLTAGLNNNYILNPMTSNPTTQNSVFGNPYQTTPANLYNNDMLYQQTFGMTSPSQGTPLNLDGHYFRYVGS